MKRILILIIGCLALVSYTANAQDTFHAKLEKVQPTKPAKQQAKELTKAGWKVNMGFLPIEEQLTRCQYYAAEKLNGADGMEEPRFIIADATSAAGDYNAAYAMAENKARTMLASQLKSDVETVLKRKVINITNGTDADTQTDFEKRVIQIVSTTLRSYEPILAIYRKTDAGTVEVSVRLALDRTRIHSAY